MTMVNSGLKGLKRCNIFVQTWQLKGFFQFEITKKCLSLLFLIYLNTYVMGLRPLEIFSLLQGGDRLWSSESDVYRRQILTTKVGTQKTQHSRLDNHYYKQH